MSFCQYSDVSVEITHLCLNCRPHLAVVENRKHNSNPATGGVDLFIFCDIVLSINSET